MGRQSGATFLESGPSGGLRNNRSAKPTIVRITGVDVNTYASLGSGAYSSGSLKVKSDSSGNFRLRTVGGGSNYIELEPGIPYDLTPESGAAGDLSNYEVAGPSGQVVEGHFYLNQ